MLCNVFLSTSCIETFDVAISRGMKALLLCVKVHRLIIIAMCQEYSSVPYSVLSQGVM